MKFKSELKIPIKMRIIFQRAAAWVGGAIAAGSAGALVYALENSVHASADQVHPYHLPWNHNGMFESLDIAS